MLESALTHLLEGCHVSEETASDSLKNVNAEVYAKFWSQLQMLLKRMLASANKNKPSLSSQQNPSTRSGDVGSLKSTEFSQLHAMHHLWTS